MCKFEMETSLLYQQVERAVLHMVNSAIQGPPKRSDPEALQPAGNNSVIIGDHNVTTQAGRSNLSRTNGDENETSQFGYSNMVKTIGTKNTCRQFNLEEMDPGPFKELLMSTQQA